MVPDVSKPILGQLLDQLGHLIILAPREDQGSCHSSVKWALTDVILSSKHVGGSNTGWMAEAKIRHVP